MRNAEKLRCENAALGMYLAYIRTKQTSLPFFLNTPLGGKAFSLSGQLEHRHWQIHRHSFGMRLGEFAAHSDRFYASLDILDEAGVKQRMRPQESEANLEKERCRLLIDLQSGGNSALEVSTWPRLSPIPCSTVSVNHRLRSVCVLRRVCQKPRKHTSYT